MAASFIQDSFGRKVSQGAAVQSGWDRVTMGTITSQSPNNGPCSPGDNYDHFVSLRPMRQGR